MSNHENLPQVVAGDPADLPVTSVRKTNVVYRSELAERITDLYLEGYSLAAISRMPEMPAYATMMRWLKVNEEFKALVDGVRATRALHFEEKAIGAAEDCVDKDDAPAARLKFDAYRWGAEVSDPTRYGKRTTIAGDPNKPVQFIIATGFPEPNETQRPPELAADGTIKRRAKPPIDVIANTVNFSEQKETQHGNEDSTPAPSGPEDDLRGSDCSPPSRERTLEGQAQHEEFDGSA